MSGRNGRKTPDTPSFKFITTIEGETSAAPSRSSTTAATVATTATSKIHTKETEGGENNTSKFRPRGENINETRIKKERTEKWEKKEKRSSNRTATRGRPASPSPLSRRPPPLSLSPPPPPPHSVHPSPGFSSKGFEFVQCQS